MLQLDLFPVLSSLVVGELARARNVSPLDPIFNGLTAASEIGRGDLGTDSLDLLSLASAVTEMFHLDETGVEEYLLRYRSLANWCEVVETSLRRKAERITFRTSGSTGVPKRCVHFLDELEQETEEHAKSLGQCRRILAMVPAHHIYGFIWTCLLASRLQAPRLDVRCCSPSRLVAELRPGDLLVGVPANWRLLERVADDLPPAVWGVTSGAACPPDLFETFERRMHFREVYGSSETAGIGLRTSSRHPLTLLPYWERQGKCILRHRNRLTPRAFELPDDLEWESERLFRVESRKDGAVQINGINVFPHRVEEVLGSHPAVAQCAVRPMLCQGGQRLKAFIVWHSETAGDETRLLQWLKSRLAPSEIPAHFTFGTELPLNHVGKPAEWPISSSQ